MTPVPRPLPLPLPLLLLGAGCVIGGDRWTRPSELPETWLVDRTRVMAIRAEPPEAFPNTTVTFEALIGRPPEDTEPLGVLWVACPAEGDGTGFGCTPDPSSFIPDTGATPTTEDVTLIGFEPGDPPEYTTPDDILDGLDEQAAREGVYVLVQVVALPLATLENVVDGSTSLEDIDETELELAYKRLVVSLATTPNHNPTIASFTVDGITMPPGVEVQIDAGEPYELGVTLPDGTREVYTFLNSDEVEEERVEEPYATFSTTSGEVFGSITLWPYMQAGFVAPEEPGTKGQWIVVLRDRRGGMGWWVQDWVTM